MSKEELDINVSDSLLNNFGDSENAKFSFFPNTEDENYNQIKIKCNKCLRKKFKKYKIRKNWQEDPEVIDVSEKFNKSLSFSGITPESIDFDLEDRPKNYLAKMVRDKNKLAKSPIAKKNISNSQTVQKNKTDAFKLLMNSRNKSIGSNSPGKECDKVENSEDTEAKRNAKAKRLLVLQEMAEAKGASKRKQLEEYQEKCVKQKMANRANRLKKMIAKSKKTETEAKAIDSNPKLETHNSDSTHNPVKDMGLIGILCPNSKNEVGNQSIDRIKRSVEDEEFLKKLSPSLRKKENMLSYFKKVEKEDKESPLCDSNAEESTVIKVKFSKKQKKKSRLSLKKVKEETCCEVKVKEEKPAILIDDNKHKLVDIVDDKVTRKRKRKLKENIVNTVETENSELSQCRPRRSIRKPIKYLDEMMSSSDEDAPIITLKKLKPIINNAKNSNPISKTNSVAKKLSLKKSAKALDLKPLKPKVSAKLAPIFASKTPLDLEALEAKQRFLQSGVPEKLKKIITHNKAVEALASEHFQTVVHVQQYCENDIVAMRHQNKDQLFLNDNFDMNGVIDLKDSSYNHFLSMKETKNKAMESKHPSLSKLQILQNIKDSYPEFPVFRTYKTLKAKSKGEHTDVFLNLDRSAELNINETKCEDPKVLCWTDKYTATSTKQIIGNFESIKELRKWLTAWKESNISTKNSQLLKDVDLSDFYQSDSDSKDCLANSNNLLIVTGPTGCGKTSSIYAVANELSIKVIEVNASSRRTGKILLQDLQEATLSHKVNRGKGSSADNSQSTSESNSQPKYKKHKTKTHKISRAVKTYSQSSEGSCNIVDSQEMGQTDVSLILIDDADIVFEQDDGFISGITQLIQVAKRPVILVASSLTSHSLHKFTQCGNIIKLHSLLPRMLGTWLDVLCMADSGMCWPGVGAKVLSYNKGDIRKSMNYLQFLVCSEKLLASSSDTVIRTDSEENQDKELLNVCDSPDENSNMSWTGRNPLENKCEENNAFKIDQTTPLHVPVMNDIFHEWWNITDKMRQNNKKSKVADYYAVLDCFSMADNLEKTDSNRANMLNPWQHLETDSVTENENHGGFNSCNDLADEIAKYLADGCKTIGCGPCAASQDTLSDAQRERGKVVSHHNFLSKSVISPMMVLDRRATALDYWPTCRTICRMEQEKTNSNSKRNNRFYHYLKTSKVSQTEVYNKLCKSLVNKD